jgi:hypothetical protein
VDSLLHFAVHHSRFAKGQGVHIINKAGPRSLEGRGVAGFNKVDIVEEVKDW